MANIIRNFHLDLKPAPTKPGATAKPVIVTDLTKVVVLNKKPGASARVDTMAAANEYEVICPNCGRVEVASTCDQFRHRCNCGYGVYVEMLRTSPN